MKTMKYYLLGILAMSIISCETDDSDTDETLPTFSFRITGDGFTRTFTQDDDFENLQLNLRHDVDYDFILSGGDAGGTKIIQMQYPKDYIEFTSDEAFPLPPWELVFPSSSLSAIVQWEGDPDNPLTGSILNGTLRPNGDLVSIDLYFRVEDFGGASGSSNVTDGSLNTLIDDHETEVITFN